MRAGKRVATLALVCSSLWYVTALNAEAGAQVSRPSSIQDRPNARVDPPPSEGSGCPEPRADLVPPLGCLRMTNAAGLNVRDRAEATATMLSGAATKLNNAARQGAQRQIAAAGIKSGVQVAPQAFAMAQQQPDQKSPAPFGERSPVNTATPITNTIEALGRKARSRTPKPAPDPIVVSKFHVNSAAANSAMGSFPAGGKPDVIRACQYQGDDAASLKKPVLCQRMILNQATGKYEQAADAFWSAPPLAQSGMSTLMAQGVILFETAVKRFNEMVGRERPDPAFSERPFGSVVAEQSAAWRATASANEADVESRAASNADLINVIQSGMSQLQATAAARQAARAVSNGASARGQQPPVRSTTPAPTRSSPTRSTELGGSCWQC